METTVQAEWFVLDLCPKTRHRAVGIGDDENGRATLVVAAPTLVTLLLDVISDPSSSYLAFAIDTSGRCTLQDREGRIDILLSDRDGLYDLGGLGWTCRVPATGEFARTAHAPADIILDDANPTAGGTEPAAGGALSGDDGASAA